jgi:hypothetical protein
VGRPDLQSPGGSPARRRLLKRSRLAAQHHLALFHGAPSRLAPDDDQPARLAREAVADLRAAAARYPHDVRLEMLVAELLAHSRDFAELRHANEIAVVRSSRKVFDHPLVGRLELDCEVLHLDDCDQRLIVYTATPGSASETSLRLLPALERAGAARTGLRS